MMFYVDVNPTFYHFHFFVFIKDFFVSVFCVCLCQVLKNKFNLIKTFPAPGTNDVCKFLHICTA